MESKQGSGLNREDASAQSAGAFVAPPAQPLLSAPHFHVVLREPEIPNNTGNIGRTCVATGCRLHLVRPLGFELTEKACRRAGLDYWPRLDWVEHADWASYERSMDPGRTFFLSTKAARSVFDVELRRGDHLVFGRETRGLPRELLEAYPDRVVSLPLVEAERSLNLATAVCAVVYEGIRQLRARGECRVTPEGRLRPE
ncbi:MAG: tRNA (cytidine(34)-2'-O)-methyltransferase [Phycisphaeraceae bacterium]|nr:tRNA (cytidine(34)-2'-O)-methyltransferase [Phycisphaeraceae bacterium]